MPLSRAALSTAALALLVAGCSDPHVYDQAAHRQALEESGVEVTGSMEAITRAAEAACESEDPELFAIGFLAEGGNPEVLRINVEQVCPDRMGEFEDALVG